MTLAALAIIDDVDDVDDMMRVNDSGKVYSVYQYSKYVRFAIAMKLERNDMLFWENSVQNLDL